MSFLKKWVDKLTGRSDQQVYSEGLDRSNNDFANKLLLLFDQESQIDDAWMEKMMITLIQADVSVKTAKKLMKQFSLLLEENKITESRYAKDVFRQVLNDFYGQQPDPFVIEKGRVNVLLLVGVNGSGKTTSCAKLAYMAQQEGYRVGLVAADTFRAAAVSQLEGWAQRLKCQFYRGRDQEDPSSVLVEAAKKAQSDGIDLLICDTAGRLQTKVNLMNELSKMKRVLTKVLGHEPDRTYLVVDATLGQNSLVQAQQFNEASQLDGIILTKLDGSSKGGIIFSIVDDLGLKVAFVGLGEQMDELRLFQKDLYFESLLPR